MAFIKPCIVAHRGYAAKYPENTITAFEAAALNGARFIELDVQVTSDHVPIIMHDDDLLRTTGVSAQVMRTPWSSIANVHAGEEQRFGAAFKDEPIPKLTDLVTFLQKHPQVKAFVELKTESLHFFGQHLVVSKCLEILEPVKQQCAIISYDLSSLIEARNLGCKEIGWILTYYKTEEQKRAEIYQPNYLICNYKKIKTPIWQGGWQWFLYEIVEPDLAVSWAEQGVKYIETMEIVNLLNDPRLRD